MSTTTRATVETLTAEVRVLKVGNRQITLSVAKQLDVVPFNDIEPFGRIKLEGAQVIGRERATGALAVARVHIGECLIRLGADDGTARKVRMCWARKQRRFRAKDGEDFYDLPCTHRCRILLHEHNIEWCYNWRHEPPSAEMCESTIDYQGHGQRIERLIKTFDERHARQLAALDMPLIVLAGLK